VRELNTPLSSINRMSRLQKSEKDILELNNTKNGMNLTDIYRIFHFTPAGCTFFSAEKAEKLGLQLDLQNRSHPKS
jgi:hypothetical protein